MQEKYEERIKSYKAQFEKQDKNHNLLGYVKLICVGLFLVCLYRAAVNFDFLNLLLVILFLELSIMLFVVHAKVEEKRNYYIKMGEIYQAYIDRMNGQWTKFDETGADFSVLQHPYCSDLDIAGKNSLYQRLCSAGTWHGKNQFAQDLLNLTSDETLIINRQNAILELSKDINFNTDLQYKASKISNGKKGSVNDLLSLIMENNNFYVPAFLRVLAVCLPIISILFLISGYILGISGLFYTGAVIVLIQFVLWAGGGIKLSYTMGQISSARYKLLGYVNIFNLIEKADFNAALLKEIQADFSIHGTVASKAVKELNRIIEMVNMRNNVILYVVMNVFLLWDFRCADSLYKWQLKYGDKIEDTFIAAGKIESLLCFSNMSHIEEICVIPHISYNNVINAEEIGHPLISQKRRVNNSFCLNNEIFIVSGSNMSGKTTFLRTVGINMVLALNGGFVCAKDFESPIVTVATSMRIVDDLNEGISTFYAELSKIKNIVDKAKENKKVLFLIDEIFRGTNSKDRIEGAKTVLNNLSALGAIGLITTHDLELCTSEDCRVKNFSFSEHYSEDEIFFDYRLKEGMSVSTNAKFLMKKLGLI